MFLPDPSGHRDVALGLCRSAGALLLVLNARSVRGEAHRVWDLPGGTVEAGEDVRAALAREWREEVGWDPSVGDLLLVVDGAKRAATGAPPLYTWRAFLFDVAPAPFGAMPAPGAEIERVEFVPLEEAALRMTAPYQAPVRRFLRGEGPRHARVDWIEPAAPEASPPFPAATRRLLVLVAAAVVGDGRLVALEASAGVADGIPVPVLEEALLQVVPYAGFPRALAAFAAARPALGPAGGAPAEAPPSSFGAAGDAAFRAVYGETADRVGRGLAALHPLLPAWTTEFAYGRVLSRPAIDLRTRELMAVSILTALGRADDALLGHMRAAVRLGAAPEAVAGAIAVVPSSAGPGRRAAARALLERL